MGCGLPIAGPLSGPSYVMRRSAIREGLGRYGLPWSAPYAGPCSDSCATCVPNSPRDAEGSTRTPGRSRVGSSNRRSDWRLSTSLGVGGGWWSYWILLATFRDGRAFVEPAMSAHRAGTGLQVRRCSVTYIAPGHHLGTFERFWIVSPEPRQRAPYPVLDPLEVMVSARSRLLHRSPP